MVSCDELYNLIINLNSEKELEQKYEEMIKIYPDCIEKINLVFYDMYEYEYIEIIEKDETIEQREKRLDTNYRNIIREKYKTCMITGKPLCVSQVAHIYPHTLCKPYEKYDQDNGFLLSAELHILFDNFQFKINPDTLIMTFSQDILDDDTMSYYKQYHNKKIELSDKQKDYLRKKYK